MSVSAPPRARASVAPKHRPSWLALVLALGAVAAAIAYAIGPATSTRTIHEWSVPPNVGTSASTSLILVADTPETMSIMIPCRSADGVDTFRLTTTADDRGLTLVGAGESLTVTVGGAVVMTVPWEPAEGPTPGCPMSVAYREEAMFAESPFPPSWIVTVPDRHETFSEGPAPVVEFVTVTGSADLRMVAVAIETRPHGSSPTMWQWTLGVATIVLAAAALVLVAKSTHAPPTRTRTTGRIASGRLFSTADVVVIGVVVVWMFVGPVFWDDWWVISRHRMYPDVGRFTNYSTAAGAEMPFGYWYDWLLMWWTRAFEAPVVLRIVPAGLVVGGWYAIKAAIRWVAPLTLRRTAVVWTAAVAYLGGMSAWLMTLRPEPLVSLLCVLTLIATAAYVRRGVVLAFAVAVAFAALSTTAHPGGFVALAPIIAGLPGLERNLRAGKHRFTPLAAATIAVGAVSIVVFLLDSDITLRLEAMNEFRSRDHGLTPLEEPERYIGLSREYGGTVLRRLAVGTGLVTIVAFLLSAVRRPWSTSQLAGWSLVIAPLLLWLTPSKWVWHFGSLVGLATVALAIEAGRFVSGRRSWIRTVAVSAVAVGAAAWAFGGTQAWTPLDLTTLMWPDMPLTNTPTWMWAGLFAMVVGIVYVVRRAELRIAAARAVPVYVALVSAMALIITSGYLITDAAVSEWTFGRQNIATLGGGLSCGLANTTNAVTTPGAIVPPTVTVNSAEADADATAEGFPGGEQYEADWFYTNENVEVVPDTLGLDIYGSWPRTVDGKDAFEGSFHAPWHGFDDDLTAVYAQVAGGRPDGVRLAAQFGRVDRGVVSTVAFTEVPLGAHTVEWRSVEFEIPQGANAIRLVSTDATSDWGGWVAFSEPFYVAGPSADLVAHLSSPETRSFVPAQFGLYFPCTSLPSIAAGVAEVPHVVVHGIQPADVFGPAADQVAYRATAPYRLVTFIDPNRPLPATGG